MWRRIVGLLHFYDGRNQIIFLLSNRSLTLWSPKSFIFLCCSLQWDVNLWYWGNISKVSLLFNFNDWIHTNYIIILFLFQTIIYLVIIDMFVCKSPLFNSLWLWIASKKIEKLNCKKKYCDYFSLLTFTWFCSEDQLLPAYTIVLDD